MIVVQKKKRKSAAERKAASAAALLCARNVSTRGAAVSYPFGVLRGQRAALQSV